MEVKPKKFYYLLHPRPVVVIIARCSDNKINAMTASWVTPISEEPPTIAVAIDRTSFTHKCLEYSGEATINIPSLNYLGLVYKLGTISGKEMDKINVFRVELAESKRISTPRWAEAIGWLEVKVDRYVDVGEVRLYIFEVVEYYMRKDAASEWGWDTRKANLVLHGVGKGFYTIGRFVLAE